ncbi:alpha/beta-hydrolase [Lojkania enalia]|uniref:Alpha/beta-hydrolase n=1 Tax=Lojkania enalia TaxID=147567 RepID=A0A9P4K5G4_9PLEO|nr:alpha/beta-hydrolase [Didymosphaeria enalia]
MKGFADSEPLFPPGLQRRSWSVRQALTTGVLIVLLTVILFKSASSPLSGFHFSTHHTDDELKDPYTWKWSSIEATETLQFHPCYDGFECAKLKLPLDYFNGTYPKETISVALAKLPARVSVDDPRYGGPVLINPGGPGGRGVLLAVAMGQILQAAIDSAENRGSLSEYDKQHSAARYFDIIGFDPRGIGETEPPSYCLSDGPSSWSWRLRESSEGILGSSDAAMGRLWSMNHAYGTSCKNVSDAEDGPDIKQYMTTASVARDMLEIVERHAEYVASRTATTKHASEKPKLQYWGFSYGTYLGSTFASMFPDRVGRLVLDGVVNSDDYNASLGNGSLHDTEKVVASFYHYCAASGPESCPLAASNSVAKDVEDRVHNILRSIYHNPVELYSAISPEVLTYSDIRMLQFLSLYQPAQAFPLLAQILAAVEARHGEMLDQFAQGLGSGHVYSCPINGSASSVPIDPSVALYAILCSDGEDMTGEDITEFDKYWNLCEKISPTVGAIWASLRMKCASWKIKAVHRFQGNFGGSTSHPILWISNTADPVTPLRSGKIMSAKFPGSVQLVQDSAGHCSIATPTPCTLYHIRRYFQTGSLPDPNTICIPPASPFSLNSTDPHSPFYDPSLFAEQVELHEAEVRHIALDWLEVKYDDLLKSEDEDGRVMKGMKELSKWMAENNRFFLAGEHHHQRIGRLMKAASGSEGGF